MAIDTAIQLIGRRMTVLPENPLRTGCPGLLAPTVATVEGIRRFMSTTLATLFHSFHTAFGEA